MSYIDMAEIHLNLIRASREGDWVFCIGQTTLQPVPVSSFDIRERFIDVAKLATAVGQDVCKALPGMHAFTVSAFECKGKLSALKLLLKSTKYQEAFIQLRKNGYSPETCSMSFKISLASCMLVDVTQGG